MSLLRKLGVGFGSMFAVLWTLDHFTFGRVRAYDSAHCGYLELVWRVEDGAEPATELLRKAVERCDKAIRLEPNWHPAYYFRAETLVDLGEIERAAADLRRCVDLYDPMPSAAPISSIPSLHEALELLATCERRLGEHERALDTVLRLEESSDPFVGPSIESVLVRRALGQRQEAHVFAASMVEAPSPFVRSEGHLAHALLQLEAGAISESRSSLDRARASLSSHPESAARIDPAIESTAEGRIDDAKAEVLALLEEDR